jgi:hypothetical protein
VAALNIAHSSFMTISVEMRAGTGVWMEEYIQRTAVRS